MKIFPLGVYDGRYSIVIGEDGKVFMLLAGQLNTSIRHTLEGENIEQAIIHMIRAIATYPLKKKFHSQKPEDLG